MRIVNAQLPDKSKLTHNGALPQSVRSHSLCVVFGLSGAMGNHDWIF